MAEKVRIEVDGLLKSDNFHMAVCCAEDLFKNHPEKFETPIIKGMLECDWDQFVDAKKIELKGDMWSFCDPVMCFVNGNIVGNHKELIHWAQDEHNYDDFRPEPLYSAISQEAYKDYFLENKHTFVYMDISVEDSDKGRLLFELFSDVCPKTCENFKALCTGEKGTLPSGLKLNYANTHIHRIVPNGWIQGGDILHGRGDSGHSIYGEYFEDENFAIPHNSRGILGMANNGRHTNASQFYITLQPTQWMDCQYVAFGKLVEGTEVLKMLENLRTFNERPLQGCRVNRCGKYIPSV